MCKKLQNVCISQPLFNFKEYQASRENQYADPDDDGICQWGCKFRHVNEVHAIPSCDECERHEDARFDCQDRHDPVLFKVYLCLIQIPDLGCVVCKRRCHVVKSLNSLGDQMKVSDIVIEEEFILVFLKFLAEIQELGVVHLKVS